MKTYMASPPDVLRVNEKHMREYYILNRLFIIITTNHLEDGLYLPADDRRHYVAWSEVTKESFEDGYWPSLWRWYERDGGYGHVAAWLAERDISAFDPKAPPPKTEAFWRIVDTSAAPEEAELADALDKLKGPGAATIQDIAAAADGDLREWLMDRKNRRAIPHRLGRCGYVQVRSDTADDGLWKRDGRRQAVFDAGGAPEGGEGPRSELAPRPPNLTPKGAMACGVWGARRDRTSTPMPSCGQ